MCQNIDDFNRGCAMIFAALYQRFPAPFDLDITALESGMAAANDTEALKQARLGVYSATVKFLRDEGYLRYTGHDTREWLFLECVLTSRGLSALNRTPQSLKAPQKTIGDTLIDLSRNILRDAAKETAKQAVSAILGG